MYFDHISAVRALGDASSPRGIGRIARGLSILASISLGAQSANALGCAEYMERFARVDFSQSQPLRTPSGAEFRSLYNECDLSDTFARSPLPKRAGQPAKCSTDPNQVRQLVRFPDGTILFDAKAAVDADGSPVSCGPRKSDSDQCQTWLTYDTGSPHAYVDAEQVPFVVVPGSMPGSDISFMKVTGIGKGDLALIMYRDRCVISIVGDLGPYFRLGEISLAAHRAVKNEQCRGPERPCQRLVNGGNGKGLASGVRYVVFPQTRPIPLTSNSVLDVIDAEGAKRILSFLNKYAVP